MKKSIENGERVFASLIGVEFRYQSCATRPKKRSKISGFWWNLKQDTPGSRVKQCISSQFLHKTNAHLKVIRRALIVYTTEI